MAASEPAPNLVEDLLSPLPRATLVTPIQAVLGVTQQQAERIVAAFDAVVARPMEANLQKLSGRDLAKRNPMIYTVRGVATVEEWVDRVLADKETSAIENHLGTFLEEVARIVSGGIKPGSGIDLQLEDEEGVVQLYAIQTATSTKNSSARQSDIAALKRAAKPLRAHRLPVEMNIAVLAGREKTGSIRDEPDITVLGSNDFWERLTGIKDFPARLLKASMIFTPLVKTRAADEVARIRAEAMSIYGDRDGGLKLDALASPPILKKGRRAPTAMDTASKDI